MAVVLLAEDEPALGSLQRTLLEALGHQVHLATDGLAARRVLEEAGDKIEILITDACMPGCSGPELVRWLRQQEGLAKLPVVITSGTQADAEIAALLDRRTSFGAKPLSFESLASLISQLLNRPPTDAVQWPKAKTDHRVEV